MVKQRTHSQLMAASFVCAIVSLANVTPIAAEEAAETRLLEAIKYLASDELEGRGVGTKGLEKAAEYLAAEFSKMGLKTDVFDGAPFQTFEMLTSASRGPDEDNTIKFQGTGTDDVVGAHELQLGSDFEPLAIGGSAKVNSSAVFVGYGVTAKDRDYDDYAGLDVEGKVVIILRKNPQQGDQKGKFSDSQYHAFFNTKVSNAYEHGAAAVILVNDAHGVKKAETDANKTWNDTLDKLAEVRASFRKKESPADEEKAEHRKQIDQLLATLDRVKKQLAAGDFDKIPGLLEAGINDRHKELPVFFAKRAAIDPIIQAALGANLAALEEKIDEGPTPHSGALEGWQVACQSQVNFEYDHAKNVAAILEGEGPLADETIIVGAHYDHLGMGGPGSMAPWTNAVHNGADDNASGTATLLEVARALSSHDQKPARRILFMAFAGEERGLLGSAHYVKNAAIPIEKTVAMVNMDMVGRLTDNKLIVTGTGTATEFDGLLDELNKTYEFDMKKDPSGHGPSDHQTFYVNKVPAMHFFTGTHNDYHRPSDDYDKINVEGMSRVAGIVTDTVTRLAAMEARPTYQQTKSQQRRSGTRPYFGSIPDFGRDVEGYALMGVAKDSPAEKAGIKAGDVIVKFGESKVASLEDIDGALRKYKPGDEVKVVVVRDDKEVEVQVKLAPPR